MDVAPSVIHSIAMESALSKLRDEADLRVQDQTSSRTRRLRPDINTFTGGRKSTIWCGKRTRFNAPEENELAKGNNEVDDDLDDIVINSSPEWRAGEVVAEATDHSSYWTDLDDESKAENARGTQGNEGVGREIEHPHIQQPLVENDRDAHRIGAIQPDYVKDRQRNSVEQQPPQLGPESGMHEEPGRAQLLPPRCGQSRDLDAAMAARFSAPASSVTLPLPLPPTPPSQPPSAPNAASAPAPATISSVASPAPVGRGVLEGPLPLGAAEEADAAAAERGGGGGGVGGLEREWRGIQGRVQHS